MRSPLIRQGEGPAAAFERIYRERKKEREAIERICNTSPKVTPAKGRKHEITKPGDPWLIRGVPIEMDGRGPGATDGSDPYHALDAPEWAKARRAVALESKGDPFARLGKQNRRKAA